MNKPEISHQQFHTSRVLKTLELSQQVNMGKVMFISINFFKNQTALVSNEKLASVTHEQKKGGFLQEVVFPPSQRRKAEQNILYAKTFHQSADLLECTRSQDRQTA